MLYEFHEKKIKRPPHYLLPILVVVHTFMHSYIPTIYNLKFDKEKKKNSAGSNSPILPYGY